MSENITPRPLERRVRLVGRETMPGVIGFCYLSFKTKRLIMKHFTVVVEIDDDKNAKPLLDAIENLTGIKFVAGSWSHVMRERDNLLKKLKHGKAMPNA